LNLFSEFFVAAWVADEDVAEHGTVWRHKLRPEYTVRADAVWRELGGLSALVAGAGGLVRHEASTGVRRIGVSGKCGGWRYDSPVSRPVLDVVDEPCDLCGLSVAEHLVRGDAR
jgi:hypothetical protein